MKQAYKVKYRLTAYILIISLSLQSCSNFSNTPAPKELIAKSQKENIQESNKPMDINQLVGQEFNTEEGYLVKFREEDGKLNADLRVDEKQKEPNYRRVPVTIAKDTNLNQLAHSNKETQKRIIHFNPPKNGQLGSLFIMKGGLLGGMTKEEDEEPVRANSNKEEEPNNSIPNDYLCPISHEIMSDPVVAKDGHTYDRSSIEKWFKTKGKPISPKTNKELSSEELVPNYSLRSIIQDFKENLKKEKNTTQPSEIILFCGNPGVGKSTLCNSIFGKDIFKSGTSIGIGLTTKKQQYMHEGKLYIDTPGLEDVKMRQEAAREIEEALKNNGNYKIIFVATLEAGRIRLTDFQTINTVCSAIKTKFEYGLIFNKVSKNVNQKINHMTASNIDEATLEQYLEPLQKKPTSVTILKKDSDLDDQDNVYFGEKDENRMELLNFIDSLKANVIKKENVGKMDVRDFDEKVKEIEEKYKKTIADLNLKLENLQKELEKIPNLEKKIKEQGQAIEKQDQEMKALKSQVNRKRCIIS